MGPNLCNISHIIPIVSCFSLRNSLNVESPACSFTASQVVEKVLCMIVFCFLFNFENLLRWKVLNANISLYMVLNKECFTLLIHPFIWVSTETIHVSIAIRDSSLWEEEHNILNTNWIQGNKVPWHAGVSHVSLWVSLSRVDNIRELNRILDKEEWCIVANKIDYSFFSVELDSESSRITIGVWKTFFS